MSGMHGGGTQSPSPLKGEGAKLHYLCYMEESTEVCRHPVAIMRRDGVYGTCSTCGFLYYFFIGKIADKKMCGG